MLILDEPLASLDLRNQREIVSLLTRLHHELDVTILVVAHDLNPLLPILDSAIYLLDGHAHYAPIGPRGRRGTPDPSVRHADRSRAHTAQGELYMRSV